MILEFYEEGKESCKRVHEILKKFPNIQVFRVNVNADESLPLLDLHQVCVAPTLVFLPSLYTLCGDIKLQDLIKAINKY